MPQKPANFDGAKFQAKFNLTPFDFRDNGAGQIVCPSLPNLTDADLLDCVITQADIDAATTARNSILTTAQSAVGTTLANLTQAQIKALMACLLYAAGGVDPKTLSVRPLSEWLR